MGNEYKRGEVYYARYDDGVGSEMGVGRPVVIVSNDIGNETSPVVNVLFMTSAPKHNSTTVPVRTNRRISNVLCNQVATFDKMRLGDKMCTLTEAEMAQIDERLALTFGLPRVDLTVEARLREQIAELKAAKEAAEVQARVDSELYKKLYERTLEMLVEKRLDEDLPEEEEEYEEEELEYEEAPGLVDINSCEYEDLRGVGLNDIAARMVIAKRPYKSVEDLRDVPGVTRLCYQIVASRLTVSVDEPVVEESQTDKFLRYVDMFKRKEITMTAACKELGISQPTWYEWRKKMAV